MSRALKQAWWAPLAALLVLAQLAMLVAAGTSSSEDGESKVAGAVIALVGAVVLAAGLWKRPDTRGPGNALIVLGALFAAFWFWTLVLPVVATVLIVGVIGSEVRSPAATPRVP